MNRLASPLARAPDDDWKLKLPIVCVDAAPPVTPFTCHVTVWFEELLTVAMKVWGEPARTLTRFGDTETLTEGGAELTGGAGFPAEALVLPAQFA